MGSWSGFVQRVRCEDWQVAVVAVIAVVVTVALAGCLGFGGGSSQSVSDVQVASAEGDGVAVAFNYSVTANTTAVFEASNGTVLMEQRLSPDSERSTLSLGGLQPGEYELVLRQGDKTIASRTTSFAGADPKVTAVSPNWSGNTLESVVVTVQNNGDLPTYIRNATVSVRGTAVTQSFSQPVPANESRQFNVSTIDSEPLTITDAGTVNGSVEVQTTHGPLTGAFQRTFQGANLTFTAVNETWNGSRLEQVTVSVQNDGDLPTTANVTIQRAGEQLAPVGTKQIPAGWTKSFETTTASPIYAANFGETTSFVVAANASTHRITRDVTRDIPPAEISIESMTPVWEKGQLAAVEFNATNAEHVAIDAEAHVSLTGTSVTTSSFSLPASSTKQYTIGGEDTTDALFTPTTRGTKDVKLTLTGGGTSDSTTAATVFDGRITSISATFASSYDDDTAQMSAVNFDVQNTGYIPIGYDSAEITIDGTTRTDFLVYEHGLARDDSTSEHLSTDLTVSSGMHELTIRLINDGETVLVESATVVTTG